MRPLYLLLFAGFFISLSACQSTVQEEEKGLILFSDLNVQYRQNDRLFLAEAVYSMGDSINNAQLTEMTAVTFQGAPMEKSNSAKKSLFYKASRQSDFQEDLKFKITNPSGQKSSIDLHLNPIESFLIKDQISKKQGLTLTWQGLPLSETESLLLLIADKNNKAASSTIKGPTQRAEIQLEGTFLKDLQVGEGNLFLVRKTKGEQSQKQSITQFELSYYTAPLAVKILP